MKVVCYLRASSGQQVESGLGLEAQEIACKKCAKKIGFEIQEFFSDEGLSGATSLEKRPGMLDAISSLGKDDVIVVATRDRIARDLFVVAMIEAAIKRKGAKLISAAGEGTESDDPSSILVRRMIDVFGEHERLVIKARTKAALDAKKQRNERVGHIPFGYQLAPDGVHIEENKKELRIIKKMKILRKKGYSVRKIADKMNQKKLFNRKGAKWNHSSVHRVMKNKTT